jgi:hypothetical protein
MTLTPGIRSQIRFGENARTGCSLYVSRQDLSEKCDDLKAQIVALLLGEDASGQKKKKDPMLHTVLLYRGKNGFKTFFKNALLVAFKVRNGDIVPKIYIL